MAPRYEIDQQQNDTPDAHAEPAGTEVLMNTVRSAGYLHLGNQANQNYQLSLFHHEPYYNVVQIGIPQCVW
jgi:hypothetical protein